MSNDSYGKGCSYEELLGNISFDTFIKKAKESLE